MELVIFIITLRKQKKNDAVLMTISTMNSHMVNVIKLSYLSGILWKQTASILLSAKLRQGLDECQILFMGINIQLMPNEYSQNELTSSFHITHLTSMTVKI